MTLSKQLLIIISLLFLFIFIGTFYVSVSSTRDFLEVQLESHAQDTATSLGVSLRPLMMGGEFDLPEINSTIDVIFDRGYYHKIILMDMEDNELVSRIQPIKIEGIPQTFIDLFGLPNPEAETLITSGWSQAGYLKVASHPGFAYVELWGVAVKTFNYVFSSFLICMVVIMWLLRIVLKPLKSIEKQAVAISNQSFMMVHEIPYTREFRRVVNAMNQMSAKVERTLSELTNYAEYMRYEAYADPLTDLTNRRGFSSRLEHLLETEEESLHGAVVLIRMHEFGDINKKVGYQSADHILIRIALVLRMHCEPYSSSIVARIGGCDFAVLLPSASSTEASAFADGLSRAFAVLRVEGMEGDLAHIGVACYQAGDSPGQLMSAADLALSQAQSKGLNAWHILEAKQTAESKVQGAQEWQRLIASAVKTRTVVFMAQPIKTCPDSELLYYEFLARIKDDDGELVPAGALVPMAERLGLITDFDKLVVEKALAYLGEGVPGVPNVAINLSGKSVRNHVFMNWFMDKLNDKPGAAKLLIVEISEYGAQQDIDGTQALIDKLHKVGTKVAIEHFGTGFTTFSYLRSLRPDFIKIDGSYIRGLAQDKESQFYLHILTEIAHGLDIKVIGECTENEDDWKALCTMKMDGAQGYYVGNLLLVPSSDRNGSGPVVE